MQEKAMIVHEPESVVSHLEAIPRAEAQDAAVRVVVYLRRATSFDIHQDTDGIRLALQSSSPAPVGAMASVPVHSPTAVTPPPVPLAPRPVAPAAPILATAMPRLAQMSPAARRGAFPAAVPSAPSSTPVSPYEGVPFGSSLTEPPVFVGEKSP